MAPRRSGKRSASGGSASKKGRGRGSKKLKADEEAGTEGKEEVADLSTQGSTASTESKESQAPVPSEEKQDGGKSGDGAEEKEQPTHKETTAAGDSDKPTAAEANKVLEKGHLYFFYRPKVDAQEVHGPGDVQKFYILMCPEGAVGRPEKDEALEGRRGEERQPHLDHHGRPLHRLLVLPSKSLPGPHAARARPWAFVDTASSDLLEAEHNLERYSYDTKTRGHREVQPARLCGEAHYELLKHDKGDTDLVYELELPQQPTEVQRAFGIDKEGQFIVLVKNPTFNTAARSERWAGFREGEKAEFPAELQKEFIGIRQPEVRYRPLSTPDFLNYRHCELVLMPSRKDVHQEWGPLVEQMEREVEEEGDKDDKEAYHELQASPNKLPDAVDHFK